MEIEEYAARKARKSTFSSKIAREFTTTICESIVLNFDAVKVLQSK